MLECYIRFHFSVNLNAIDLSECISKLKDLQGQAIECPLCHKPTLIPLSGVESLVTNLDAVGLGEPEKKPEICRHCVHKVYPPKPATLFCKDCESSYCGTCSDVEHLKPENVKHLVSLESLKNGSKNEISDDGHMFISSGFSRPTSMSHSIQLRSPTPRLSSRLSSSQILDSEKIPGTKFIKRILNEVYPKGIATGYTT